MPNGHPDWISYEETMAEYEQFFAPIAPTLSEFAVRYNLFVERYYHESPCWSLCFAPPQGGFAKLDICRASDTSITVGGVWWVDDYKHGTRSLKWTAKVEVERDSDSIERSIIATFNEILNSKPGEWNQVATGYHEIWSQTWTKEQFDRLQHSLQFPIPNLTSFK